MAFCLKCKVEGIRKKATKGKFCQYHYEEGKAAKRAFLLPIRDYWYSIIGRCYKEHWKLYATYGAKGYTVAEVWHDKVNFIDWAKKQGYRRGLLIKFHNEDCKVYSPENCYIEHK